MNKTIDALKLALDFIERTSTYLPTAFDDEGLALHAAIREALAERCVCGEPDTPGTHRTDGPCLAEQPAQQQEPVEYWTVADGWVSEQTEVPAAAWIYPEFWDHCKMVGCGTAYRLPGAGRQPLYTSPPAAPASQEEIQRLSALVRAQQITIEKLESQRQWVGLTDEQIEQCMKQAYSTVRGRNLELAFARAIEANLKEKNA